MNFQTCSASAPGKIILNGEHAAVYGRPAIAIPVAEVNAIAEVSPNAFKEIRIHAPDIHLDSNLDELPLQHPIAALLNLFQKMHEVKDFNAFTVNIRSTIPIAAGMGSSAAISVAIIRALSQYFDLHLDNGQISNLAYEIEKIQHGSPSGIDNTVVTYQQPVFFQRNHPTIPINPARSFTLLVGDTGIPSKTSESVGKVKLAWEKDKDRYNTYFDEIAEITAQVKHILEGEGAISLLGDLLTKNHAILQKIGVSCDALDKLVNAAIRSGSYGAKLCGSGDGGNMITLVSEQASETVRKALLNAGAVRVLMTKIGPAG